MEELSIGSEIILKVIEYEDCRGCFFDDVCSDINVSNCSRIKCTASERKDNKNIQFKRVK